MNEDFYAISLQNAKGKTVSLEEYRNKVLLIVNVASLCGFTSQYKGLEDLYQEFKEKGFEILAFPCNQFGEQEPHDMNQIESFCSLNYGVSFPLFQKIEVNGKNEHPLYTYLKKQAPGFLGIKAIKWNFTKFLVDSHGNVVERFAPNVEPHALVEKIRSVIK
jgi:glutathione peroxidase